MRYDKYDPKDGGFRAALHADMVKTPDVVGGSAPGIGVALTNAGRVVPCGHGSAQTGFVGVVCLTKNMKAGDIIDVMTDGEIVEFGGTAGTRYAVTVATGAIVAQTSPLVATQVYIGHTVEVGRLVVRCERAALSQVP